MKYRKEEMPICAKENIPLFVMYIKKELSTEQEKKLDKHIQSCSDCAANFAYVEEILLLKQPLSIDEKTLLLKYITDPLWYYSINAVRKQILAEVKELLHQSNININPVNANANSKALDSLDSNVKSFDDKANITNKTDADSFHNSQSADQNVKKNIYHKYSYFVLTILIAVFIILSTSIALITKTIYPDLESFLPSLKSSSPIPIVSVPNITNSQQLTSVENNLYQQVDIAIDEFLSSQNKDSLNKATSIAKEIKDKYQDKYGVDLVNYYQSLPPAKLDELSNYHKQMLTLINSASGSNYEQRLKDSQELEEKFLKLGNIIEAYRVKIIINKLHVVMNNYELAKPITDEGLKFSIDNNYLFLQGYFLLYQANRLSEVDGIGQSQNIFEQAIVIGEKIQVDELTSRAKMSLATLYHLNNDDKKSLEMTQSLLARSEKMKKDRIVSLMQLAGLAASNLKSYDLSKFYLNESIRLSEEINNLALRARSYIFLSLVSAELKNFSDSEDYHLKAISTANQLTDYNSRLNTLSLVSGYYGKTKLLEGDFDKAAKAYQQTLAILEELNLNNNLELSQLNEGLAIALQGLNNPAEAKKYFANANHLRKLAENTREIANCFLSFIPSCQTN